MSNEDIKILADLFDKVFPRHERFFSNYLVNGWDWNSGDITYNIWFSLGSLDYQNNHLRCSKLSGRTVYSIPLPIEEFLEYAEQINPEVATEFLFYFHLLKDKE